MSNDIKIFMTFIEAQKAAQHLNGLSAIPPEYAKRGASVLRFEAKTLENTEHHCLIRHEYIGNNPISNSHFVSPEDSEIAEWERVKEEKMGS